MYVRLFYQTESLLPSESCHHCFFLYRDGDHRDLHVLTHSFPTRRPSDLVLVADRHPEAGVERRLAAEPAERLEEAEHLSVGEGVVLRQHRQLAVAFLVVDVLAEAGHPLGAVGVEAEEVVRRLAPGSVLGGRGAVPEGTLRLGQIGRAACRGRVVSYGLIY